MPQVPTVHPVPKALQRYPEIIELTEARKRAIAGGRAGIEEALKRMIADAKRPSNNVIDYKNRQSTESTG